MELVARETHQHADQLAGAATKQKLIRPKPGRTGFPKVVAVNFSCKETGWGRVAESEAFMTTGQNREILFNIMNERAEKFWGLRAEEFKNKYIRPNFPEALTNCGET